MNKTNCYLHTKTLIAPITYESQFVFFDASGEFLPRIVMDSSHIIYKNKDRCATLKLFTQLHKIMSENNTNKHYYIHQNGIIDENYDDDLFEDLNKI
jgi:hypothetical protein